ncbi:unnamed protein product [Urochloa humidicola]
MSSKRATLELVDVDYLLHRRVLPSQPFFSKYPSLHKPVHQLFKHEPCFGDFELDNNSEMCQTSQMRRNERSLLQDGRQEDDMMMTTNERPLIMMWSKTAPKGTKRALPYQQ